MPMYHVLEPHVDGTTLYSPTGQNNTRDADENDVQHLVELGVLSTEPPKAAKSEGASDKNKSEGAGEKNKSEGGADKNK